MTGDEWRGDDGRGEGDEARGETTGDDGRGRARGGDERRDARRLAKPETARERRRDETRESGAVNYRERKMNVGQTLPKMGLGKFCHKSSFKPQAGLEAKVSKPCFKHEVAKQGTI